MRLYSAKDLDVYKKSYLLAMRIFEIGLRFPVEETALSREIGKMLGAMIKAPSSFLTSDL